MLILCHHIITHQCYPCKAKGREEKKERGRRKEKHVKAVETIYQMKYC